MEKYKNEKGEIGVLVSYGFGSGWSTWCLEHRNFLAMDKTLVEMKLDDVEMVKVVSYLERTLGEIPYMSGWHQVRVEWIKEGTAFVIEEYDGSESLRTLDDLTMCA